MLRLATVRPHIVTRLAALLCVCAIASGIEATGDEIDLRLQIEWVGGADRTWEGLVSIDRGGFSDLQPLGIDSMAPGTILLRRTRLIVHQERALSYNGAIVSISGDTDSTLRFEFVGGGDLKAKVLEIPLDSLVGLTERGKNLELDDTGNKLWIRRAAGDDVRVAVNRPHLVFRPGEDWSIDVMPHLLAAQDSEPRQCRLAVKDTTGEVMWNETMSIQASVRGRIPPLSNIKIDVPETEGVYLLEIDLISPTPRFSTPFRFERSVAKRSVQFVVVEENRPAEKTLGGAHEVIEFDPAEDRWWDRLKLLPQWSLLPGLRNDGQLGNRKPESFRHGDSTWVKIRPGGWQAYPLPVDDLRQRHELTIEFPGDIPQTTTFSIVEPNAAGKVLPIGLDSGIRIDDQSVNGIAARPPQRSRHTISFWPNTKSPLLLVTNVDSENSSILGPIRVSRVPAPAVIVPENQGQRKLFATFDRPLFNENFSAIDQADPNTRRSYEDWTTFYDGGRRMVEYLRGNGFDGVALSCYAEGSSLYPDGNVQPSPKYDRGVFFSDGRDPLRKDVMEMLFRLCDRESVTLVPTFEFSTRLPNLEAILHDGRSDSDGVRLVNHLGQTVDADSTVQSKSTPLYNPLDIRVQQAMLSIVRGVARRYGNHPSFGGVKINVTPDSFTQLPGATWAMDRTTLRRFRSETSAEIRDPNLDLAGARQDVLASNMVLQWQSWRCRQLAQFFGRVHAEVLRETIRANVYLNLGELLTKESLPNSIGKSLTSTLNIDAELTGFGIDLQLLAGQPGLVIPQPQRLLASTKLFDQAAELELSHSDDVAKQFRELPIPATQFHHESIRRRLESFDELSPFGRDKTYMSLVAHVSDSGVRYRERFAHGLARNDSLFLFDGGWMLPLGQEEALGPFARTYRQLPLRRFATVTAKSVQVRPLMIRQLDHDGETYFYLVNDSPWDVGVDLRFDTSDRNLTMRSLGVNRSDRLEASGEQYVWSLNVEPYELIAVAMSSPKVELVDGISTLPPDVDRALDQRIEALTSRSRYLGKPTPLPTLANADFEKPSDQQLVPSWQPALVSTGQIGLGNGYKSGRSLTIATDQESLVVRSAPFARPDNGQLAIELAAKFSANDDKTKQLGARMVVESAGSEVANWNEAEMRISELADGWSKVILPLKSLTVGTGELSLRIELAKSRHLQLDNVRIYDTLLLDPDELRTLSTKISLADFMRRRGYYADCNRFLNSYWPQYLMQFVPEAPQAPPTMTRRPQPQRKPIRTSDRWKRYIPRFPGMR